MNFAQHIPKDLVGNLRWRREMHRLCAVDLDARRDIMEICSRDVLFWWNAFCWTLDPRKLAETSKSLGACIPFITWPYQDKAILELESCLSDGEDVLVEKSRDMGASWIMCGWMDWRWIFRDHQSFLLVSRKEMLVDGDEDSLFAHLRFINERLPRWMLSRKREDLVDMRLQLKNKTNGSVIDGESTTKNIGRGGRRTAIALDEFAAFEQGGFEVLAATADTTNCRLFNSTPNGTANAFYAQREKGTRRIRFHWSLHPEKRRGLYKVIGPGEIEKLDPEFDYEADTFEPIFEVPRSIEGFRSPWYDMQCRRRAHAWEIAQELDIDYQGSAFPFFGPALLDELRKDYCREPNYKGVIENTGDEEHPKYEFRQRVKGQLLLWCKLDPNGYPERDREYGVSCDVSQGTGASDSVATVTDFSTGEKVGELAGNKWNINRFAELVFSLCGFFSGTGPAYLIWEATGPGRTFGKIIVEELRYKRFYMHRDNTKYGSAPSQRYGWFSTQESKKDLLQTYREMLTNRSFLNPSSEAIREAGFYVYENNRIEYRGPTSGQDSSNKGTNHGDRVIADARGAKLLFEYKGGRTTRVIADNGPPVGSKAWRDLNWNNRSSKEPLVFVDSEW